MDRIGQSTNRGFTLIEALIAVVIFSIGLIAVAKFQGGLMHGSGLSKARSKAVQLAQEKMEQFRNQMLPSDHTSLVDTDGSWTGNESLTGDNAIFTRSWKITDQNSPGRKEIEMRVSWTDPRDGAQEVILSSTLVWKDPAKALHVASGGGSGGVIPLPQGGAEYREKTYDTLPETATDNSDGTSRYTNDADDIEIIDNTTGDVLLVIRDGYELVIISGRVYIRNAAETISDLDVMASDASFCAKTTPNVHSLTRGDTPYTYFDYRCYVAGDWYGSIGVLKINNTGNSDQGAHICIGDPYSVTENHSRSRHYRGYASRGDADGNAIIDNDGNTIWFLTGVTQTKIDATGSSHDFLVISGNNNTDDEECVAPMVEGEPGSGPLNTTDANNDGNKDDYLFYENPPKEVCLTPATHCPDAPEATISGRFEFFGATDRRDIDSVTGTSGSPAASCTENGAAYVCEIASLPDAGWSGKITFTTTRNNYFCDSELAAQAAAVQYIGVSSSLIRNYSIADSMANCPADT